MCKMAYRSKQFGPYSVRPAPPYRPAKGGKTMLRTLFRDDNNLAGLLIKFYSRFHDSRICFIEFYPIIYTPSLFPKLRFIRRRSVDFSRFHNHLILITVNIRFLLYLLLSSVVKILPVTIPIQRHVAPMDE